MIVIYYVFVFIAIFMDDGNDLNQPNNKIQEIFHEITKDGTICLFLEIIAVILFFCCITKFKKITKETHTEYDDTNLLFVDSIATGILSEAALCVAA